MHEIRGLSRRLIRAPWSLRFRVTLAVTLALGILITVFIAVHYTELRQQMLEEARGNLVIIGQVIEGGLEHTMLTQDPDELQRIVDRIGQQPEIRTLMLLNRQSEIRFAPEGRGVGTRLDLGDPGCQACHRSEDPEHSATILLTSPQGEPLLRYCIPIANQPVCHACHGAQQRFNGALIADVSLAATENGLDNELRLDIFAGLVLITAGAASVNALLDRLILRKLDRLIVAIRRFGHGDFAQRVAPEGGDEIAQVATTFNDMADGLEANERETRRLSEELQHKEAARTQLLQRIIAVQEEERKRIARELHDDFAQTLTALTLSLETVLQTLPGELAGLRSQLTQVQDLTTTTLGQTHDWIQDLRPQVLDDLGLLAAIRWYAETRLSANGTQVELDFSRLRWRLPAELETTLFRVVQEAINNVTKHARATRAWVYRAADAARVVAEVEDNGAGFDPGAFLAVADDMRGIGLLGMQERVALVGGTLSVDSHPGAGTRVRIEVPWTP